MDPAPVIPVGGTTGAGWSEPAAQTDPGSSVGQYEYALPGPDDPLAIVAAPRSARDSTPHEGLAAEHRTLRDAGKRSTLLVVATLFGLEILGLVAIAVVASINMARNPWKTLEVAQQVNPGQQVLSRIDILRAAAFFAGDLAVIAVFVLAVIGALRARRARISGAEPTERVYSVCLLTGVASNVIAVVVSVLVAIQEFNWYRSQELSKIPSTFYESIFCAAACFATFFLGTSALRDEIRRKRLKLLLTSLVLTAVLAGTALGVQRIDTSSYVALASNGQSTAPSLADPLQAGFWTVTTTQHAAAGFADIASCGSIDDCALVGVGNTNTGGGIENIVPELSVTADGGESWKTWQIDNTAVSGQLEDLSCRNTTCVAVLASTKQHLLRVSILPGGRIEERILPGDSDGRWDLGGCLSDLWCAAIDQGSASSNSASSNSASSEQGVLFDTSNDGGQTWTAHTLPTDLVPEDDILYVSASPYGLSCPSAEHCFLNAVVYPLQKSDGAGGVESPLLAVTTDGGTHWKRLMLPHGITAIQYPSCTDTVHCLALGFPSLGSSSSVLLLSSDGGLKWETSDTDLPVVADKVRQLGCSAGPICIAAGTIPSKSAIQKGAVFRSLDGGHGWQRVKFPKAPTGFTYAYVNQPTCYSASFCVMNVSILKGSSTSIGSGVAAALVSDNGGITWKAHDLPPPQPYPGTKPSTNP